MSDFQQQDNFEEYHIPVKQKKPRSRWRRFIFGFWIVFLICALIGIGGSLVYKTGFTFNQISVGGGDAGILPLADNVKTPEPDADRKNILLLGLRGEGDENGGLLTDSIMVISIQKSTGRVALISIPRDLYVTMPGETYKEKINYAYALGYEKKGAAGALFMSKTIVSRVTGLYIDHTISVDHAAFKEIVDILGGIDIYLKEPFVENQQWVAGGDIGSPSGFFSIETQAATSSNGTATKTQRWVFKIPAGTSHLDGKTALYYARARYSSSDFDRARRQQQILVAIKDKALSLGFWGNPVKIFNLMDSVAKNVRTDMTAGDIRDLIGSYSNLDTRNVVHKVFDTTPEGLLHSGKAANGAYILTPVGDNFDKIQEACRNIFN